LVIFLVRTFVCLSYQFQMLNLPAKKSWSRNDNTEMECGES
jgi:hypothetical protein